MLSLLLPEWQGYGLGADVHYGATALAAEWFGRDAGTLTIDAPVAETEPLRVAEGVLGAAARPIYIHFDVDVVSMNSFDGALMATPPGGPTLEQAAAFIKHLATRFDVVGLSVLELCDRGDAVKRVAASLKDAPPVSLPA